MATLRKIEMMVRVRYEMDICVSHRCRTRLARNTRASLRRLWWGE